MKRFKNIKKLTFEKNSKCKEINGFDGINQMIINIEKQQTGFFDHQLLFRIGKMNKKIKNKKE